MYIDTHAHLYMEDYKDDLADTITRAQQQKIMHVILPNVDSNSLEAIVACQKKFPDFFSLALGLHPSAVTKDWQTQLQAIEEVITQNKPIAIGEVGIDLYWDKTYIKEQIHAFECQLDWAQKLDLPVIIHARKSFPETFTVLKNFPKIRGVFHCFSGGKEEARKVLEMGTFYLGIGGVATFKNSKLLSTLTQTTPLEKLILETDAPYLAPTPHRGKRNEPSYIPLIAKAIAETYEVNIEQVEDTTTHNACKLFNITLPV